MKKRISTISVLLFFQCVLLISQVPHFLSHALPEDYKNATIERMFQDRNNWMYFGTSKGLLMYDGLEFFPLLKNDNTDEYVSAIYQCNAGNVWVGYRDGSTYNIKNNALMPINAFKGCYVSDSVLHKIQTPVTGFVQGQDNNFWFSTYGQGVYCAYADGCIHVSTADGLLSNDIYVMQMDATSKVWVGTDAGISVCSLHEGKPQIQNITTNNGLPDLIVRDILFDAKGNAWIGMHDKGICYYDTEKQRFEYPMPGWDYGVVYSLALFEDQEIWIGTENNGLWRYVFADKSLVPVAIEKFHRTKTYDLMKDAEGNIWVLNNKEGVCHANRQFERVHIQLENIQAIISDQNNVLWIGCEKGLFTCAAPNRKTLVSKQHLDQYALNVTSLYEDAFGNLWIGTFGDGLYCYNTHTGKVRHITEEDGLTNGTVLSIDGNEDHVWLATLGGATEFFCAENILNSTTCDIVSFNQDDGLGTNFIYKVFVDSEKRTWFATDGKGISVLQDGKIQNFSDPDAGVNVVYSLAEDNHGYLWLSTPKQGLFRFDEKDFQPLQLKEGVRDLSVTGLIKDKKGNILIVHPGGVDILHNKAKHLSYYGENIGIQDIDPNLNAICEDKYQNIWIATQNNLIKYTPLSEQLTVHPVTNFNGITVASQPVDISNGNVFTYNENNIIFKYVGLWYNDPSSVRYKYRLSGYDPDWIRSKDQSANYSNLRPGKYTFTVVSGEGNSFDKDNSASYSFEILPPLWKRAWFIVLVASGMTALLFWYIKIRDKRLQKLNLLEKEKAESHLAALKAQINPHFLFNSFNTLTAIIEENPSQAVEYVEKLSDFYRSMMQYRDKEVISLKEEIKIVNDYYYLLKQRFGDNFKMEIDINQKHGYLAPLSLQTLVENAVKHNTISKADPLYVKINDTDGHVIVSNNLQRKMHTGKSTHFGLRSLSTRYELLTGKKIQIEESDTQFMVAIPIVYEFSV